MPHRASGLVAYMRRMHKGPNADEVLIFERFLQYHSDLDQKASSTLTFLGLLLAATSILFVGSDKVVGAMALPFYSFLGLLFGATFLAALLCLSCFAFHGPEDNLERDLEDTLEALAMIAISRRKRYALALKLTFASAIAFAILVLVYLVILLN